MYDGCGGYEGVSVYVDAPGSTMVLNETVLSVSGTESWTSLGGGGGGVFGSCWL